MVSSAIVNLESALVLFLIYIILLKRQKRGKAKSGAGTEVPEDSRDHHDLQNSGQGDKEAAEYRRTEVNKFYFLFMHFPNSIFVFLQS